MRHLLRPAVHAEGRQPAAVAGAARIALGVGPGLPGDVYIGRRNVEGGGRQDHLEHTDYRYVLGAKGDLFDNTWNYNFWWQSGKNVFNEQYQNDFSKTRITRALDVVKDPATGKPVCASVLDGTDPSCVPYDVFHTGGVTQAALDYLQTPGFQNGYTSQSVVGLQIDSDLGAAYGWRTPWAKNGAAVAFGLERRVEKLYLDDRHGVLVVRPRRPGRPDHRPPGPVHGQGSLRRGAPADHRAGALARTC